MGQNTKASEPKDKERSRQDEPITDDGSGDSRSQQDGLSTEDDDLAKWATKMDENDKKDEERLKTLREDAELKNEKKETQDEVVIPKGLDDQGKEIKTDKTRKDTESPKTEDVSIEKGLGEQEIDDVSSNSKSE